MHPHFPPTHSLSPSVELWQKTRHKSNGDITATSEAATTERERATKSLRPMCSRIRNLELGSAHDNIHDMSLLRNMGDVTRDRGGEGEKKKETRNTYHRGVHRR